MNQRVYVTTAEGSPSFLVHRNVRDKFITEEVERRYGRQADDSPHEWEAYEEMSQAQSEEANVRV